MIIDRDGKIFQVYQRIFVDLRKQCTLSEFGLKTKRMIFVYNVASELYVFIGVGNFQKSFETQTDSQYREIGAIFVHLHGQIYIIFILAANHSFTEMISLLTRMAIFKILVTES